MAPLFDIREDLKTPKYLQIVQGISKAIRNGSLRKGEQVFSINELSDEFLLGRETVQKAYNILRERGLLISVPGKGYYVDRTDLNSPFRVLLLFNKISNYKRQIYSGFVQALGIKATVDLKLHHCNVNVFENLLDEYLADYDYCVLMPHFYEQPERVEKLIQRIPAEKLLLLDKDVKYLSRPYGAVYQDFTNDIYEALEEGLDLLNRYDRMILVQPELVPYPREIFTGFRNFCLNHRFRWSLVSEINESSIVMPGEVYIVIEETDLVNLVKNCRVRQLEVGSAVGIISYNDTPLKEILLNGITVISTDHVKMGETAAMLLLEHQRKKVKNTFTLIRRGSV